MRSSTHCSLHTLLSLIRTLAPSQCAVSILNNVLIAEEARAKCLHAERDEGVLAQLLVLPALVGRATLRTQWSGMAGLAAQRSVLTLVAAKGKTGRRLGTLDRRSLKPLCNPTSHCFAHPFLSRLLHR